VLVARVIRLEEVGARCVIPLVIRSRHLALVTATQIAVRVSVSACIALAIAQSLGLDTPIFAFISAVLVIDLDPAQSRQLGWRRIVATIVGGLCGAVMGQFFLPSPWTVGLSVMITMLLCQLLQASDGGRVAAFTCGVIMIIPGDGPLLQAASRLIETLIGVSVAWSISYVPKLIRIEKLKD